MMPELESAMVRAEACNRSGLESLGRVMHIASCSCPAHRFVALHGVYHAAQHARAISGGQVQVVRVWGVLGGFQGTVEILPFSSCEEESL